jgi:hypothetical protein
MGEQRGRNLKAKKRAKEEQRRSKGGAKRKQIAGQAKSWQRRSERVKGR